MFTTIYRQQYLDNLQQEEFDVLVIGGGITGAGVFLDAQARGLKCCLIEMQDYAEGTSSRSTKLIHGGLRYLKQWNFKVVAETGRERNIIRNIARHLTYPKKVLVPAVENGTYSKFQLGLAIKVYEFLTKVPKQLQHTTYTTAALESKFPFMKGANVLGGVEYVEFQTRDARLVIENIKTGVKLGGTAINKLQAIDITLENNKIVGVVAKDLLTGNNINIKAKTVVNACGIWADQLLPASKGTIFNKISPTKGVHLVFDKIKFPIEEALYFDTHDKRMVFAIPTHDVVYLGTTDTFYLEQLKAPNITKEDVDYLLEATNSRFPELKLKKEDIIGGWSGIRPLIYQAGKSASEISRKHELMVSDFGLITIAGGKLTGYRNMAEQAVDMVLKIGGFNNAKPVCTETLQLTGSDFKDEEDYLRIKADIMKKGRLLGWEDRETKWVFSHFGTETKAIMNISEDLTPSKLPNYLHSSLLYSLQFEMITSVADFAVRRTDLYYFNFELCKQWYKLLQETITDYLNLTIEQALECRSEMQKLIDEIDNLRE